ncbi:MAG TPA: hypothetical protein PK198_25695 [Saprospiraceae bacterium]|nr:hypothetical protein [Saprospiraceae bacterium]HRF42220.1 hypothetical protein [Saprospiraceae bacterium]HRK82037.1 hypothetical protein [Saprospiraceae bacterium]
MSEIDNVGKKGYCMLYFFLFLILFIFLVVWIYNRNSELLQ